MQVHREFSPEIAKVLQNIDEEVLRNLLQEKKSMRKQSQMSKQQLKTVFEYLKTSNPFKNIEDPVKWQSKLRKDRELSR